MKIGILTFHRSYNFGANLQTIAVQSALTAKGHSPVIVNYHDSQKMSEYRRTISPMQAKRHEDFFERYYNESPVLTNEREVQEFCSDSLDAVLVGSDAVFKLVPKYDPVNLLKDAIKTITGRKGKSRYTEYLPPYWLNWTDGKRGNQVVKASIAASCMSTLFHFIPAKTIRDMKRSLKRFDYISVRDQWTEKMVKYVSTGEIMPEICPDPVFSLGDNFSFPKDEYPDADVSKTILLSGRFANEWLESFIQAAHASGYSVSNLPNPDASFENPRFDTNISLPLSPLGWYLLLSQAAGYVGIRFHALVSCMSNQTPVINVDNHLRSLIGKRTSRMYDLCERSRILQKHISLRDINKTPPSKVLETLFNKASMVNANNYAVFASTKFSEVMDKILSIASKKITDTTRVA